MKEKCNTIAFCRDTYEEYYDTLGKKEVNEAKMFDDIAAFMRIALTNGYQMKVFDDGLTVIVEYNYQDGDLADASLEWVGLDEYIQSYDSDEDDEYLRDGGSDDDGGSYLRDYDSDEDDLEF